MKIFIPFVFICSISIFLSCEKSEKKKSMNFGKAQISEARQERNARGNYYFQCEKRTEEQPFGEFTEVTVDSKEFQFTNTENGAFEGRIIKFKIDESLKILDVTYDEWYDVIHNDRTENFEIVECGINLNINPFEMAGQELVADYFVKVKQTTDYRWSWNEEANFFTITGRFECNKDVW